MTSSPPAGGRRAARSAEPQRRSRAELLAVVVPLVTIGGLLLATDDPVPAPRATPPTATDLTRLHLVCPGAPQDGSGSSDVVVTSMRDGGAIEARTGKEATEATVRPHVSTELDLPDPAVLDARDAAAPGLVATRTIGSLGTAMPCPAPQPDYWFSGVGAASVHSSVLELVNPDAGRAVADITVFGPRGPVEADGLRGVTVPGRATLRVDLSESVPFRGDLGLRVHVGRGRLAASVVDRVSQPDQLVDWLPVQAAPATSNVLLGLLPGPGERRLAITNPSEDQARVQLKIAGKDSTFAPVGLEEISVGPESTVVTDVSQALAQALREEEAGLLLTSSVPVTAALSSVVGEPTDLSLAVTGTPVEEAALLLPEGKATVVVAAPERTGALTVTAYDAGGRRLDGGRVAARRLTTSRLALPEGTALVEVVADDAALPAAVRVDTGRGVVVLPMSPLPLSGLVPAVRPGG